MSTEVTYLLNALRERKMTLDQVAQRFRQRSWPRRATPLPRTYLERAAAAQQDPDPYLPGSFDEVAAAHQEGNLSDEQYAVLSEAVAESKRAEDLLRGEESPDSQGS